MVPDSGLGVDSPEEEEDVVDTNNDKLEDGYSNRNKYYIKHNRDYKQEGSILSISSCL